MSNPVQPILVEQDHNNLPIRHFAIDPQDGVANTVLAHPVPTTQGLAQFDKANDRLVLMTGSAGTVAKEVAYLDDMAGGIEARPGGTWTAGAAAAPTLAILGDAMLHNGYQYIVSGLAPGAKVTLTGCPSSNGTADAQVANGDYITYYNAAATVLAPVAITTETDWSKFRTVERGISDQTDEKTTGALTAGTPLTVTFASFIAINSYDVLSNDTAIAPVGQSLKAGLVTSSATNVVTIESAVDISSLIVRANGKL